MSDTPSPALRVVKGALPRRTFEVMGRIPVGEVVLVEDWTTGERARCICISQSDFDPQATFSLVKLVVP